MGSKTKLSTSSPGFADFDKPFSPPAPWIEGGKMTARDAIALALASIGDAANGGSMFPMLMSQRLNFGGEGRELEKYRKKKEIDAEFDRPNPYRFEDNAGNQMELDPMTGQVRPLYIDPQDRTYFANGAMVTVPNRLRPNSPPEMPSFTDDDWNSGQVIGGAPTQGRPPFEQPSRQGGGVTNPYVPPPRLKFGAMTSGRRTPEGNRLVGGVPNSTHLTGRGVDYDGPNLSALLGEVRGLPGIRRAFIHGDHVHGEGDDSWNVPYFGRRGTTGLRKR